MATEFHVLYCQYVSEAKREVGRSEVGKGLKELGRGESRGITRVTRVGHGRIIGLKDRELSASVVLRWRNRFTPTLRSSTPYFTYSR